MPSASNTGLYLIADQHVRPGHSLGSRTHRDSDDHRICIVPREVAERVVIKPLWKLSIGVSARQSEQTYPRTGMNNAATEGGPI